VDERIIVWDDQSEPRMWDFCLVNGARMHSGSLEVTRHTDPERRRLSIEMYNQEPIWKTPPSVRGSWMVQLLPTFLVKSRAHRDKLFRLLETAEHEGQDKISGLRSPAAMELGVSSALRMERSRGSVYPVAAGTGWFGDDHVARGVTQEAEANRDKLEAAPAPRHLFVWIDYAALAATFEMTDGSHPPPEPVALPDYVDVAWAACGEANLEGAALWRVERGRPWTVVRPFSQ
jgi:hypothetical protein